MVTTKIIIFNELHDLFYSILTAQRVILLIFRETLSDEKDSFKGGGTALLGGEGGTQSNVITIYTHVDGQKREIKNIARTATHELGHSAGLNHPWQIPSGERPESDIQQGVAKDDVVKINIMNSGANPNVKVRNITGGGVEATSSTVGQLEQISESISDDKTKGKN